MTIDDLVRNNQELYSKTKNEVYEENKNLLRFANYADKWSKTLSVPSAAVDAAAIGGLTGVVPAMTMDLVKKVPKLGFLAYYGAKSHDVVGTIGDLLYEAGSIIPFAGEILDFHERYAKKTTKYLGKETEKRFRERIEEGKEEMLEAA